jgi:hypothetical protein
MQQTGSTQLNATLQSKHIFVLLAAIVIWVALGIQFYFFLKWAGRHGTGILGVLWSYMSFFTNLSNLLAGIALLYTIKIRFNPFRLMQKAGQFAGITLFVCMSGIIFNLELAHTIPNNGLSYWVNVMLHDVTPLLFLVFWFFYVPQGILKFRDVLVWLIFPVLYFCYVLISGILIGHYPYSFFNPALFGYKAILWNGLEMLAGFLSFGLIVVAMDRMKPKLGMPRE